MRLLAVDGNSIVNRAFYGIRPLTTKDGQFTNAIYGFLTMLYKIKNEENPDAVAIAFDLKTPTFRHKAYAGYKATRKGMPEELASQMEPLKKLLTLLGYRLVTCEALRLTIFSVRSPRLVKKTETSALLQQVIVTAFSLCRTKQSFIFAQTNRIYFIPRKDS